MTIRDQIHENALSLILEANPQLIRESEEPTDEFLSGMTQNEYKLLLLREALEKEARRHRMDSWDYQLKLAEDSGMDVSAVREEDRRATAKALGLDELL